MMGYVKLGTQLGILEADNARLREQVDDLTAKLASTEGALDAYGRDNAALTRRLEEAQALVKRYAMCGHDHSTAWWQIKAEDAEAKLAAVERERDALRTALLRLAQKMRGGAWDARARVNCTGGQSSKSLNGSRMVGLAIRGRWGLPR